MAKITKTLEYRRARFLGDEQNLEQLVRRAWAKFETQAERTVTLRDNRSTCGLRSRDCTKDGIAVHCARYTDGQGVGTIPTKPAPEAEVGERPPEPGENFLNSDLMALIWDNHVICMNCGRDAGSLRIYFQQLFRKASFVKAAEQFELVRIGSPDKLVSIRAVGVKSVDLQVDISEATNVDLFKSEGSGRFYNDFTNGIGGALYAVAGRDESVEQLRKAESGTLRVSINVPKNDLEAAKNGLNKIAEEVVEDSEADGFVIHLRDGNTIKPDEVSARKQVELEAMANSVSVLHAWDAMETYMEELKENGQLEA